MVNDSVDDDARDGRRLTLRSSRDAARLELRRFRWSGRDVESYTADLWSDGIRATTSVYTYGTDGLADFVHDLAARWRGWSGAERWSSLEGQLALEASHDGLGTVTVVVRLTPSALMDRWSSMVVLALDAGGLAPLAKDVDRFFQLGTSS